MSNRIYHSAVDENLQRELNLRGISSRKRTTDDLNFMLGKIANVTMRAYKTSQPRTELNDVIPDSELGGASVLGKRFQPMGFLEDISTTMKVQTVGSDGKATIKEEPFVRNSRRVGPYITDVELNIADNSNGITNECTVNIVVSDLKYDFSLLESIYLKPGRPVSVEISYPESALLSKSVTNGVLGSETLENLKRLKDLYKIKTDESLNKFKKLNSVYFEGMVYNFTWQYNSNMTITITLKIRGKTNVYTDLNLIIKDKTVATTNENSSPTQETIEAADTDSKFMEGLKAESTYLFSQTPTDTQPKNDPSVTKEHITTNNSYMISKLSKQGQKMYGISARAIENNGSMINYITLSWLIDYINRVILSKNNDSPDIMFHSELTISNFYESLVSADPINMFFPRRENRKYGSSVQLPLFNDLDEQLNQINFKTKIDSIEYYDITNIFISINKLEEIYDKCNNDLNTFLQQISLYIADNTGQAIDLKLLTHPIESNALMWYDRNCNNSGGVIPYSVPMSLSDEYGTIVHENGFTFNASIPSKIGYMSYVTTQNYNELKDSNVAPFISYLYNTYTVERSDSNNSIMMSSGMTNEEINKLNESYITKHKDILKKLTSAKANHITTLNNDSYKSLKQRLCDYITFPKDNIKDTSKIAAPVLPISIEFKIDGVNGFRYGDILTFSILPDRYKRNVVWQIINVAHKVDTNGKWETSIKCAMKVDFNY